VTCSIATRLHAAADDLRAERTTLQFLVDAHRPQVREALLVLLGALCLCPMPGVGTVVGAAVFAMAVMSWRGSGDMNLPPRFGSFSMSRARALRVLRMLARIHELAEWTHRPRFQALADRLPDRVMSATVALMGALIALPIPLGNLLPGLALVFAGLGLLRRDGLGLMLGAGCALLGIIWPLALAVVAWSSLDGVVARLIGP
jgi:hypothetical protein